MRKQRNLWLLALRFNLFAMLFTVVGFIGYGELQGKHAQPEMFHGALGFFLAMTLLCASTIDAVQRSQQRS